MPRYFEYRVIARPHWMRGKTKSQRRITGTVVAHSGQTAALAFKAQRKEAVFILDIQRGKESSADKKTPF